MERVFEAREIYLACIDAAHDQEHVREAYEFNDALLLFVYGHFAETRPRFASMFDQQCSGEHASADGHAAWVNLRNIAVIERDEAEMDRLQRELLARQCTFRPPPPQCGSAEEALNPLCLGDSGDTHYRSALRVQAEAARATGADRIRLYERAATLFAYAAASSPADPQAPLALEQAAIALERAERNESAANMYGRIIDDVDLREPVSTDDARRRAHIVSNAYLRAAYALAQLADVDRALVLYRAVISDPRFADRADAQLVQRREDALVNSARLLHDTERFREAAALYAQLARESVDARTKLLAEYNVARVQLDAGRYAEAAHALRAFGARHRREPLAEDLVLEAYWRAAEAQGHVPAARSRTATLREMIAALAAMPDHKSPSEAVAARAELALLDEDAAARAALLTALTRIGDGATGDEVRHATESVETRMHAYDAVIAHGDDATIATAEAHEGRWAEALADALDRAARPDDASARRCDAVVLYARAAELAQTTPLDDEAVRDARSRLTGLGDDVVGACLERPGVDGALRDVPRAAPGVRLSPPNSYGTYPPLAVDDR